MVKEVLINNDDGEVIVASLIEKVEVRRQDAFALRQKIEMYQNQINENTALLDEAKKSLDFLEMIIANADANKPEIQ